ncbi:MAG: transketolase C-terminal domain-containing protein, partial [Christensenellales bacterium]|nr:transketolase C-terminal domain-containing protein [Christensenellales bacterium]
VCLQNLPVTVLVDHAGFVAGDGATHQGVYDLTMLRAMPHLTVWSPCDAPELCAMLAESPQLRGPCVIRYPRSLPLRAGGDIAVGRWRLIADGDGPALLGYGASVGLAQAAAGLLQRDGLRPAVWSLSSLQADEEAMSLLAKRPLVAVVEEQRVAGGMGEMIAAGLPGVRVLRLGVGDQVPCAHSLDGLRGACGLDAAQIAARVKEAWHAR